MRTFIQSDRIQRAAQIVLSARHVVAFTGAGISTPSGIPDFRSVKTGLWERYDPMRSASLASFLRAPEDFYDWLRPLAADIICAEPNPAHIALARLEMAGILTGIVTQNIDGLHQLAGSLNVIELHGHLREAACLSCLSTYPALVHLEAFARDGTVPICPQCGKRLKPCVVLFGEDLPHDAVRSARDTLSRADLVIIAGSSLQVVPASYFLQEALDNGADLIIINLEATYLDEQASVVLHDDVAEALPAIAKEVLGGPQ
ncbi:MAG: NAD-dependent deacylase [Anaerolineales bacterium]|nr:NAD-dependent deacylase [Anaerolineales bacterium]